MLQVKDFKTLALKYLGLSRFFLAIKLLITNSHAAARSFQELVVVNIQQELKELDKDPSSLLLGQTFSLRNIQDWNWGKLSDQMKIKVPLTHTVLHALVSSSRKQERLVAHNVVEFQ